MLIIMLEIVMTDYILVLPKSITVTELSTLSVEAFYTYIDVE